MANANKYATIDELYGDTGYQTGNAIESPMGYATIDQLYGPAKEDKEEEEQPLFESSVPDDHKLKKQDLYNQSNINTIRNYMTRNKGVSYKKAEPEKLVEDFVDHMRWFNSNTVSTAGEVMFVTRGSDADKAAAGEAYKLYDKLGNVFVNDGLYGAVDGVKDYIFAASVDPSNWVGLLTGGLAKAGSLGVTKSSKALVKKAASEAAMRAAKSGATKQAANKAAEEAAKDLAVKLASEGVKGKSAEAALNLMRANAKKDIVMRAASSAAKEVGEKAAREGTRKAILTTTGIDAVIAGTQDVAIQDIYLTTDAQDKFSKSQTAMALALGGVGGGIQYTFGKFGPSSGLGTASEQMKLEKRIKAKQVDPLRQTLATKKIKEGYKSWAAKVADGKEIRGSNLLPEGLMSEILLGSGDRKGLVHEFKKDGYRVTKSTEIADFLTNVIREMPQDELQDISKMFREATGYHLGDMAEFRMSLADLIASHASGVGSELAVYSQSKKILDSGIVAGNDIINQALNRKEVRDTLEEGIGLTKLTPKPLAYMQNVWRRTLVSSTSTTAANVYGFAQFNLGQSVSDALSGGAWYAYGVMKGNTAKGREAKRVANVYKQIQAQKMRNLMDPFTTKEAYMDFLDQNKEVKDLLFETVGAGVERTANRYNIDPSSRSYKIIERYANGAMEITGVRAQDTFTKSQMFMTELDKHLRIKKDMKLEDVLRSGDLSSIDEDVVGLALDTTMKSVFSKDYTTDDQMLSSAARLVEDISNVPVIGSIMPFGRFFNNVIATTHQWGPTSLLPGAARLMKAQPEGKVQAVEALSRSAVGTTGLFLAAEFAAQQEERGDDYNIVDVGGGTRVDIKNAFPASEFLAMGRLFHEIVRSQNAGPDERGFYPQVTKEAFEDAIQQLGVGQFARDIQFGNDMYKLLDMFASEEGGPGLAAELYKRGGGYVSGFTRPLDTVNKAVGFITETDYVKDMRQAKGTEIFTLQSARYFDNIIEAFMGEVDGITGERLRVASREGDLYDPNPVATMFGIRVMPSQTGTEKAYSLANMKTFRQDSRSKVAQYDRIFNETMAAPLNRRLNSLMEDKRFIEGSNTYKRARIKDVLKDQKAVIKDAMDVMSSESYLAKMKYDTINKARDSAQYENAIRSMNDYFKKKGIEPKPIDDYTPRDLLQLQSIIEYFKYIEKGN